MQAGRASWPTPRARPSHDEVLAAAKEVEAASEEDTGIWSTVKGWFS